MRADGAGLETEPFVLLVERGKILEFARATFSDHADHLADRPTAPPTFLATQNFWARGEADVWHLLGIDWTRALHLEQEYTFVAGPPRAGDVLVGRTRVAEVVRRTGRTAGAMSVATALTSFEDQQGRVVATARAVMAELDVPIGGRAVTPPPPGAGAGGDAGSAPEPAVDAGAGGGGGADLPDGVPPAPRPLVVGPLTRTDIVRYQGASGDLNAIHHDEPLALRTGLPATLSVGMLQAGMTASWAVSWFGPAAARRFASRFLRPVFPGDTLVTHGRCLAVHPGGSGDPAAGPLPGVLDVDVEIACHRDGVPVVLSTATFRSFAP